MKRTGFSRVQGLGFCLIATFLPFYLFTSLPFLYAAELKVTFFDVGQGDSILIEFPNGKTTLIDAGMNFAQAGNLAMVKKQPIVPYLKTADRKKIDIVLITHPHPDHIGGLPAVLKEIKAGIIYGYSPEMAVDYTLQTDIIFNPPPVGKTVKYGEAKLEFLSPPSPFIGTEADINNNSVVTKLTYKKISMLFAGDVEWAGELLLVDIGEKIRSTILKVPHHGSYTSSTSPFLDRVMPEAAVITCGKGNAFGHPHQDTIKQYSKRKIKLYRTDDQGTITVTSDGTSYTITTEF
ncbi:MAG: ComEC/Rec2 family competence protein [Elusimicrobiota bacterium]